MPTYSVDVKLSGPLFDGSEPAKAQEFVHNATKKVAETGQDWIKIAAHGFDISGRGGTGRAAAGVLLYERDMGWAIFGEQSEGQVWWPWLEGTSQRNRSTRFKGYHTFRKTRRQLEAHVAEIVQPELERFVAEMGGG